MIVKLLVMAAGGVVASAPAIAGDAPRLTQDTLRAPHYSAKSGEPRYCLRTRQAGENNVEMRCATRAEWRELGVTIAQRGGGRQ